MKYAYFGVPDIAARVLPNDPGKIFDLAMQYRDKKGKVDAFREGITGTPKLSVMQRIDNTVSDLGAGAGLGITMLGAKLNQYEPTRRVGNVLKRHGVNTLMTPELQRMYGLGAGGLALGGVGLAGKAGYDALTNEDEYA